MLLQYIDIPNILWKNIYKTGSSVICDPPVLNTDIDYVVYTTEEKGLVDFLCLNGFVTHDPDYPLTDNGIFVSMRKDNINLILVTNREFYNLFVVATKLAQKLNLLKKEQRVALFQYILYGELD